MNYFSSEFTEETLIGSNCNKVTRDIVAILRYNLLNVAFILRICYVYPT